MVGCQYSGKVIVFYLVDLVQYDNESNYDCDWAEQGLASMALHEDDENQQDGLRKGPVIMVKDPITNYPMLTNLLAKIRFQSGVF